MNRNYDLNNFLNDIDSLLGMTINNTKISRSGFNGKYGYEIDMEKHIVKVYLAGLSVSDISVELFFNPEKLVIDRKQSKEAKTNLLEINLPKSIGRFNKYDMKNGLLVLRFDPEEKALSTNIID